MQATTLPSEDKNMVISLDDLRAEVDAEDADTDAPTDENASVETEIDDLPQDPPEEGETGAADDEQAGTDDGAEPGTEDASKAEAENWMEGDDHTPQAGKTFTQADMASMRKSIQAKSGKKLDDKDGQIERLRSEIESIKSHKSAAPETLVKPKREDFYDEDDPDEAYINATLDYRDAIKQSEQSAQSATSEMQARAIENQKAVVKGEEEHYDRAVELVVKSKISAEKYQAADLAFKQAIDDVMPGRGDAIAALMVATLGKGSEKVVFNIGINQGRIAEMQAQLRADPSGLKLMSHLSDRKNKLNAGSGKSNTPAPAAAINGDVTADAGEKTMMKQFKSAESSGDQQKMMDILSSGRRKGYKTNSW